MTLELKFVSILGLSYSSLLIPFFHPFFLRSFFSSPLNDKKMNYLLYWYYLFSFFNWLMCFITLFFLMKSSWRIILYLLQAYHIVIQHCSILGVLIIVLTICTTQCYITLLTTVFPVLYFISMCIMFHNCKFVPSDPLHLFQPPSNPLLWQPPVYYVYLWIFFIFVHLFLFLNPIYKGDCMVFFFLTYFT